MVDENDDCPTFNGHLQRQMKEVTGLHTRPLSIDEKRFFLAVERGDLSTVRRILVERRNRGRGLNRRSGSVGSSGDVGTNRTIVESIDDQHEWIDVNCTDSLGRSALLVAIDNENLDMVRLLVTGAGVHLTDSLLHAIDREFVEGVEFLLTQTHRESKEELIERDTATFPVETSPLMVAGHRDNYEILKLLLDFGARLEVPHAVRCPCDWCVIESRDDFLRHSRRRYNVYKALTSPSLIALTSTDPVLSAFQLADELRTLAASESELKQQYLELKRKCQDFAVDLLAQARSSTELKILLDYDPNDDDPSTKFARPDSRRLARLKVAIDLKQKMFVAHPNVQQLLSSLWYDGLPGFRRLSITRQCLKVMQVALLFPIYCLFQLILPCTDVGKRIRKPFVKFLIHSASYLFFLLLLILASQRIETKIVRALESSSTSWTDDNDDWQIKATLNNDDHVLNDNHRDKMPSITEWAISVYIVGFIWEEIRQVHSEGLTTYLADMWNTIDLIRNSLYIVTITLRIIAFVQAKRDMSIDPSLVFKPRENWSAFDPMLIAEGLFAGANVFSFLKLLHIFSVNQHLGPLQISLGRMVIDIVKFFFVYTLVLFSFACGLNQLLWYYADLERRKCHALPGGQPDWKTQSDACLVWRRFYNLFESTQSLFWASFGMIDLKTFELAGIKSYTRFWAMFMFGSYCVVNVIVLLNLLIAMMSSSYQIISNRSDVEWKFARTKLWLNYFDNSVIMPPPFNIVMTPQSILRLIGCFKDKKPSINGSTIENQIKTDVQVDLEADPVGVGMHVGVNDYQAVVQALVWRYVIDKQRKSESTVVTEDTVNEIKQDISAFRYELLDILKKNGMETSGQTIRSSRQISALSSADARRHSSSVGKKAKVWERRLLNDFSVAPVEGCCAPNWGTPPGSVARTRFQRLVQMVGTGKSGRRTSRKISAHRLWDNLIHEVRRHSQVQADLGFSPSLETIKKEPEVSPSPSPIPSQPSDPIQTEGRSDEAENKEVIVDQSHELSAVVDTTPSDVNIQRIIDAQELVDKQTEMTSETDFQDSTDDLCPLLTADQSDEIIGVSNPLEVVAMDNDNDDVKVELEVTPIKDKIDDPRPQSGTSQTTEPEIKSPYKPRLRSGWF